MSELRILGRVIKLSLGMTHENWLQEKAEVPSSVQVKLETWKRQTQSLHSCLPTTEADQGTLVIFAASDPIRPDAIPVQCPFWASSPPLQTENEMWKMCSRACYHLESFFARMNIALRYINLDSGRIDLFWIHETDCFL